MVRTNDAVGSIVAYVVNHSTHVHSLHAFVNESPDETSGAAWPLAHHLPVVVESGSCSSIVEGVQEFCRHPYLRFAHIFVALAVRAVVHGLVAAEIALRMKHRTLLYVPFMEIAVEFSVPSLFVSVAPPYY